MAVTKIADGVWRAGTRYVNWYMIDGGRDGVTVIDAGLPEYKRQLDESLYHTGRSRDHIRAVALTHGHIDHTGMAAELAGSGASIYLHPDDCSLAANPRLNKPERNPLYYSYYPGFMAFLVHAIRKGALHPPPMPGTTAISDGAVLGIPGQPRVIHVPGHTAGSCVFEFQEHGVVFVGDLLCTVSPFSGQRAGPQLLVRGSNANSEQAMGSLSRLQNVQARIVLPGHGTPWRDGVEAAVTSAMRIGCK
jgi:glyoxylase-like metal-dependent hydrolase (beta-lactamase superfamily II)